MLVHLPIINKFLLSLKFVFTEMTSLKRGGVRQMSDFSDDTKSPLVLNSWCQVWRGKGYLTPGFWKTGGRVFSVLARRGGEH